MTDQKPTEEDLNALDVTDAEAAEINAIAHPFVADPAPDADNELVKIDALPSGVVFVTINRPEKKNAFDAATIAAHYEAFETLQGADRVRVVFIRGAGGTFSAGADLNWMRDAAGWSEADNRDDAMGLAKMLKALHDVPALTVALVEGSAMGGGAGIVAACDMAVAVEGARFAFSEVKLGLIPATIACWKRPPSASPAPASRKKARKASAPSSTSAPRVGRNKTSQMTLLPLREKVSAEG